MKLIIPKDILNYEDKIQSLLIKAADIVGQDQISEFKWVQEYQDGLIKYVEEVFKMVAMGLSLKLDVNPEEVMQKSIRVDIPTLIKITNGDQVDYPLFYKSLFTRLKSKFSVALGFFKKFGFNKGKALEPVKFKGKVKYNPETGKSLTNEEWNNLSNDIVDFLGDKIGNLEEELIVRAGLFGKLMQSMENEGISLEDQKKMDWDEIEDKFGFIPSDQDEAIHQFNLTSPEVQSIEYAKTHAAEHLSIEDGSLKSKIVSLVREQITAGLQEGLSAQEMIQRLFWIDPRDELGIQFKDKTIDAINRDWRRIAITEMSYALNNGYLAAVKADNKKKGIDSYFVFSGGELPTSSKKCISWRGTIVKMVDKPLSNDEIQDPYAKYAIWIGKNNVGRSQANWHICIPAHPHCIHFWEQINPKTQRWDEDIQKIVWREE